MIFAIQEFLPLSREFDELLNFQVIFRIFLRLALAMGLGALLGFERAQAGKAAGMRTHMLVTLAAAIFMLIPTVAGFESSDTSRIIQGVVTGIGFIGGGAILKVATEKEVHGLTTASEIWLASAIGMAAGLGRYGLALVGTALALVILRLVPHQSQSARG